MAKKMSRIQLVRRISLGIFLVAVTVLTILHQKVQNMPSIDALDPFGGIETLFKYLAGGEFIKKIMPANIVLLVGIVILGVVLSRFFCGWICAFGALQGVFGWLGKKIFKRRFVVPAKVDRILRWAKYPILVAIVYFTWKTGTLIIRPYDPLAAYGHLAAGLSAVWAEFAVGFIILVLTLVLSMFYERVFCKYVCPLGAVNAILSRIPLFRIKRETTTCISCSRCDKTCPMNIDVSHAEVISSPECIACMECVTTCPTKKNSLLPTLAGKTIGVGKIAALGLAIYLGIMGVGALLGQLDFVGPSLRSKAQTGTLAIGDIKGSSTWAEVAAAFSIDLERLYRESGVDPAKVPPETKLKDTGALIGKTFETDTARFAVSKITGIPYAGESTAPASPAATPSGSAPSGTEPTSTAPSSSAAAAPAPAPAASPAAPAAASSAQLTVPPDFTLEGTMTVKDVAAALKTTESAVLKKLQLPADFPTDKPLRDLKDQYGYTMPVLKERFAK